MAVAKFNIDPKSADLFSTTGLPELVREDGTTIPYSGYAFDTTTSEQIFIDFKAVDYLSGNLTVTLTWYSRAGSTTGGVNWIVAMAALSAGDAQSVLTDALATSQNTTTTVNGTARGPTQTVVTVTNLDSLAADDTVKMRIARDPTAGGDTMAGDAILFDIEVEYAATGGVGAGNVSNAGGVGDNDICRFDGTTGQVVQDSTVNLDDSGNLTGVGLVNELTPRFIGYARLTSAFTSSGTALQDVTGTSIAFPSAGTYVFEYYLSRTASAGSGNLGWAIDATGGTISGVLLTAYTPTNTTAFLTQTATADNTITTATAIATTVATGIHIHGSFVATAGGTAVLRMSISANTITIAIGSWGRLSKIA